MGDRLMRRPKLSTAVFWIADENCDLAAAMKWAKSCDQGI